MKNNKRLLSFVTAMTMTVSAFSGLCMSASAEDTTVTATLAHTASAQGGSNTAGTFLDAETHYYNLWGATGWIATAYSQFTFEADQLPADTNLITSATLSTYINCARGTRTVDVAYVPTSTVDLSGATAAECTIPVLAAPDTMLATFSDVTTDYKKYEIDATEAIKAMIANGETTVVFAYGNGAAGGNIYGSAATDEYKPTLTVNVAPSDTQFFTVTVNKVCDGVVLGTADYTVRDGDSFTPEYEDLITYEGDKYTYASGGDAVESVTEDTVVEVVYEKVIMAADGVYINENFDSHDAGEIIRSAGNDVSEPYPPVTKGSITYSAGRRNNGSINTNASITDDGTTKKLLVSSDNFCTNSRGVSFVFDAAMPTMDQVEAGKALELSFDILATKDFTVSGYGDITTADLTTTTETVHVRIVLDKDAGQQYLIVTNAAGEVLNSKVAALSATGFTGMTFYAGSGSHTIDNLRVEQKAVDTGLVTLKAVEGETALADTTITIGAATFTTAADGTATVALPNGTYTATASKSGYEHTEGAADNHTQDITVNSDTQEVTFTLSLLAYVALPEEVIVEGGQVFIAAPKTEATASTAAFTVTVKDQYGIVMTPEQYTLQWEVHPAGTTDNDPNVTIDNGVVSVSNAYKVDSQVAAYDVTVAAFTDDRNNKVTTTLYVANNDIIYYEPVAWVQSGGTGNRNASLSFADAVTLPDMSSVTIDVNFTNGTEGQRSVALVADGGTLVGLQLGATGTIKAWTGWSGNRDMNQYSDVDAFANSAVLVEGYVNGTELSVTFVIDKATQNITVSCGATSVSLPYTITANTLTGLKTGQYRNYGAFNINAVTVQEPDKNYLSIIGDVDFAKVSGTTVTRAYELGQSVLVQDETFTWSVAPADQGVTVDENGVLSVADTAVAGTYELTATSAINAEKTATLPVKIDDFQVMAEINIVGPRAYELTNNAVAAPEEAALAEEVPEDTTKAKLVPTKSADNAVLIRAIYDNDGRLVSVESADMGSVVAGEAIDVSAAAGTKVMLWNSLAEQEPLAAAAISAEVTAAPTAEPTDAPTTAPTDEPTPTPGTDKPGTITGTYTISGAKDQYGDDVTALLPAAVWTSSNTDVAEIDAATGVLTVKAAGQTDITATITNGTAITTKTITVYVSTYAITGDATGDATTVDTSAMVADAAITKYLVTTATADGVEVKSTEVEASAITAGSYTVDTTGAAKYEIAPIFEYTDIANTAGTLGMYGSGYVISVPSDTYNFELTVGGSRCDVYANNQMLVNNILQGGGYGNEVDVNDIVIDEGAIKITTADYATNNGKTEWDSYINYLKVVKSPSIVTRVSKMYVLGDSLVCVYYNGGSSTSNYQTGWGQVLGNYTKGVEIVNLANSGATANGLKGTAFTQILESAKEGDYLVLESGYNDRTYDTEEVMKNALRTMITESEARGVKVILVSPNASAHTYGASVSWTGNMEAVATETETDYIDLSQLSYDFFQEKYNGDGEVLKATYNVSDRLHSTYHGANLCASIVAKGLADLGYTDIVNTEYTYTFTDSLGNEITCQAK